MKLRTSSDTFVNVVLVQFSAKHLLIPACGEGCSLSALGERLLMFTLLQSFNRPLSLSSTVLMKVITFSPDGQLEKKGERTGTLFIHSQQAAVNSLGEITLIKKTLGQTNGDQCGDKGRSLRISENRMHCNIQFTWWPEKWSVSVSHCDKTQNAALVWIVCFMISPISKTCKRQLEEVNHKITNILNNYSTYIKQFYESFWNTLGE